LVAVYFSQSATEKDYKNNLMIIEAAMPLHQKKDSVLISVFRRMHAALKNAYAETQPAEWALSFTPNDFKKLIDKAEEMSRADQLMLVSLWSYYNSLLSSDDKYHQYERDCEIAEGQLDKVVQDYATLYKQFFGEDFNKGLDEFKKKYSQ
jgi:hypothetical protein